MCPRRRAPGEAKAPSPPCSSLSSYLVAQWGGGDSGGKGGVGQIQGAESVRDISCNCTIVHSGVDIGAEQHDTLERGEGAVGGGGQQEVSRLG